MGFDRRAGGGFADGYAMGQDGYGEAGEAFGRREGQGPGRIRLGGHAGHPR
jgi:hypothetical protein